MKNNLLLISLFLFFSCSNKSSNQEGNAATVIIPEDFVEFYEQFHQDTSFQIAHIIFPLDRKENGMKWHRNEWVYQYTFDNSTGEFLREFGNFENIITEVIADKNGMFRMERRFTQINGVWSLIYYTIEGPQDWNAEKY